MKLSAVICEYNPFHNGHAYQLEKANRQSDGVICVMSGDFVQRAEPAVCDKYVRAECALRAGAAMVIELPVAVSVAPGERFARGAVEAVGKLPHVKKLFMGCETQQPSVLEKLADIQLQESQSFKDNLKKQLETGASYAQSYAAATVQAGLDVGIDGTMSAEVLAKPNNLLCIEYIKAIRKCNLSIEPIILPRKGNNYNDLKMGEFASASAIRANLHNPDSVRAAMPPICVETFLKAVLEHPVDQKLYQGLLIDALRRSTPEQLGKLPDIGEGLEHKLYKNALQFTKQDDILDATKSKRYTRSRLKRICLSALLQYGNTPARLRVLGIRETFKPYLANLGDSFYVKTSELDDSENIDERRADALYTLITGMDGNRFYSNRLLAVH